MKNDNSNTSLKRGRPPKKDYDPEALMRELIDTAAEIYREKGEIKATALELSLPPGKVKKLLITGNVLFYPETKQIQDLMRQGKTMLEIQHIMGLSYSTLHTYLPYSKVIYKMSEISQNAERVKTYKARKSAVDTLMAAPTEGHLWDCIMAMHNFIDKVEWKETEKKDYVLYFGRFSEEKGILGVRNDGRAQGMIMPSRSCCLYVADGRQRSK